MDKAGKVLRRGGVRLKNMSSGHGDLHMVISDLTEVRSLYKSLISAQSTVWEDLVKWANREKNVIIQESLVHFSQLHALWAEVQREFVLNLKKFKHQFEMILEGELHIDKSRAHLKSCEQREAKIRKEIKQNKEISNSRILDEKLNESKEYVKAAQAEVSTKMEDQEAVKVIMLKDGLTSLSDYYIELSEKAVMIFESHKRVSEGLPDVKDQEIHNLRYTNNEAAKKTVVNTRENILCYRKTVTKTTPSAPNSPPPYTSGPTTIGFETPQNYSHGIQTISHSAYLQDGETSSTARLETNQTNLIQPRLHLGFEEATVSPPEYSEQATHRYDLPPRELYENIDGPFGDMSIDDERRLFGAFSQPNRFN